MFVTPVASSLGALGLGVAGGRLESSSKTLCTPLSKLDFVEQLESRENSNNCHHRIAHDHSFLGRGC